MGKFRNIFLLMFFASLAFTACNTKTETETIDVEVNTDSLPTMVTRDVKTLISDSGMTRYRITAKLWLVYDKAETPVWKFPVGLFIEKFDDQFNVDAHIKCDSATYFTREELWRLDGDVEIRNLQKELFLTEQIFWSQKKHKVYSDSFIHIEKDDRIIEGYGFDSNERLTVYEINRPSGIFPVEEKRNMSVDTVPAFATDTLAAVEK